MFAVKTFAFRCPLQRKGASDEEQSDKGFHGDPQAGLALGVGSEADGGLGGHRGDHYSKNGLINRGYYYIIMERANYLKH